MLNPYRDDPFSVAPQGWCDPDLPTSMFQTGTRGAEGAAVTADGDPVGLILDRSGNNVDFTQSTAGSRPTYKISGPRRWLDFDGTDDYMINAAPGIVGTGYPFSFGCWFNPDTASDNAIFAVTDTGVAAPGSRIYSWLNSSSQPSLAARGAAAPQNNVNTTTAVTIGEWHYGIWRFISATNRRISILYPNGVIQHAQSVTSVTLASLDSIQLGAVKHSDAASTFFNGKIGEDLWFSDSDIQPDGLQLNNTTLLKLAYGGPAL